MIIGLSGKSGTGKSLLATYLTGSETVISEGRYVVRASLSTPIVRICRFLYPTGSRYKKPYTKEERRNLQRFGSMVRAFDEDAFVRHLEHRVSTLLLEPEGVLLVIDDVRYPNEARWVRVKGGELLRLDHQFVELDAEFSSHGSETALDDWEDWDGVYLPHPDGTPAEMQAWAFEVIQRKAIR